MTAKGGRAEAMANRVAGAARRAGTPEPGIRSIDAALRAAMRPRIERLADDHDPDFLHPGRTVLILLEDLGITDAATLCAGALAETLRPELRAGPLPARAALAPGTIELLEEVPVPARDGAALLERLVTASEPARLVALAERLDHARHLHLGRRDRWMPLHRETCELYLPLAERSHPTLARRLRWWCRTFARRFLDAPRGDTR